LRRYLVEEALPAIFDAPGVLGVHFDIADRAASDAMTAERQLRGTATSIPSWIVLVEGISVAAVAAAGSGTLAPKTLATYGTLPQVTSAVYRLETSRTHTPAAAG
jgi:hypothetical protein